MGCIASIQVYPHSSANETNSNINPDTIDQYRSKDRIDLSIAKSTLKIPLTEKEAFSIGKSWKAISRNMTTTGITMFLRSVSL